jgi:hypothetical protein
MQIIRFLVISLLVFVIITVAAFVYLEWWQAMLVMALVTGGIMLGLKLILRSFGNMLGQAMIKAFEVKAAVMAGAKADVHSVTAAPAPPPKPVDEEDDREDDEADYDDSDDDDDEPETPRVLAWYRIDVTITPGPSEGSMRHWDVGDLVVVDHAAKPLSFNLIDDDDADDPGEGFHFEEVQILEDGELRTDDEGKYEGAKRLNVLVGVPPELHELKFRYYTEQFGRVVLPAPIDQITG